MFEAPTRRSELFLQPTVPAFEYPRSDLASHVRFIGALLPESPMNFAPPAWWNELSSGRPVVLVTQGTVATSFEELLLPAVRGLGDEDVLVIATIGGKSFEGLAFPKVPSNVRLETFVPFAPLMPHVSVMVTNGGYGGTHSALTHGVPLVGAGTSEDKAEICARIAWSGVGINLRTSTPKPEQIRRAVSTVLTDPRYRRRAQEMRDQLSRLDAATAGAELIESLAA